MLHLYYHPRSTFSRRVRVALLEKQIEHEATVVDLATGEHRKPAFLALNPYGRVPVIDDKGFVLYESAATAGDLADQFRNTQDTHMLVIEHSSDKGTAVRGLVSKTRCFLAHCCADT
jgi:glutathione S-transferase